MKEDSCCANALSKISRERYSLSTIKVQWVQQGVTRQHCSIRFKASPNAQPHLHHITFDYVSVYTSSSNKFKYDNSFSMHY